ncbi:MAG: hypothetical protein H6686_00080 [Fibrobacteria bacterium]|nr:hypothetical protein [Fibrobacteria bacterium]
MNPSFRTRWVAYQLAIIALWFVVATTTFDAPIAESWRVVVWAIVAASSHTLLGSFLIQRPDRKSSAGIHGGLVLLVVRYFTGIGLVLSGLVAFPEQRTIFVLAWSGLFLILTVSEMIVFIKGVHRL